VTSYIDPSALVAVYVNERFSKPARRAFGAVRQVVILAHAVAEPMMTRKCGRIIGVPTSHETMW
jgi:hypothetical protein